MRKVAIIDFSSSSVSLLIAKVEGAVMESLTHTRTPLSFASTIYQDRELTEIEVLETEDITESFIELSRKEGVSSLYAIASANLSGIKGMDAILDRIADKTGLTIYRLDIAAEAEARLIANERYNILPRTVLVDFGSATLKLYSFSNYLSQVPLGPLTIAQDYVSEVIPSPAEAKNIKQKIRETLEEADLPESGFFENAVLAGVYAWAIY